MKRLSFMQMIQYIDVLGNGVGFTIQGSSTHKTLTGGLFTMILSLIILAYSSYQLQQMTSKNQTLFQSSF